LVEDVEETIDPAIDPILLKQQSKSDAGILQIRLGDANVDYDENFKFFMTTKMPNPHYIPEICIKVTLINFTVTFEGLQQQMLGDVVIAEKPEIEQKRDQIVLTMAADAATLKALENNILKLLSEATLEQILDEDTLIDILESSKKTSGEINERMEQSKIVEVEINDTRNLYTSVAVRGSILYFVIADMGGVDPMYQNSLLYVKSLFNKAIELSPQANTIEERLDILINNITRMMYKNISRGLFEKDKMIYSLLIVTSIRRNAKVIDEAMWNILLRGPSLITQQEADAQLQNPDPEIISKIAWDVLYSAELKSAGQFADITQHVVENWEAWKKWIHIEQPYEVKCPAPYDEQLSGFDKLILMKVFRPEMIAQSCVVYIINEIGQYYAESPSVSMNVIYEDIDKTVPLIFVLSTGADPTSQIQKFA
jgi:dynein heavy chain